jgi:hypothetical protein
LRPLLKLERLKRLYLSRGVTYEGLEELKAKFPRLEIIEEGPEQP